MGWAMGYTATQGPIPTVIEYSRGCDDGARSTAVAWDADVLVTRSGSVVSAGS